MARTRSIAHALDGTTVAFLYRKNNPSTGLYYTDASLTSCTVEIRDVENPTTALLAASAMTYVAALKGYRFVWTYGAALVGVRLISVLFSPTRVGVAAALAPEEAIEIDLADVLERIDAVKMKTDTLPTDPADNSQILDAIALITGLNSDDVMAVLKAFDDLRREVDVPGSREIRYADDGTTPDRAFPLEDADGDPITETSGIFDRGPGQAP